VRIATIPVEAEAEPWDPQDQEPFKALTGPQFLGVDEDGVTALVRAPGGCVQHVHPGWLAFKVTGAPGAGVRLLNPAGNLGDGPGCSWRETGA